MGVHEVKIEEETTADQLTRRIRDEIQAEAKPSGARQRGRNRQCVGRRDKQEEEAYGGEKEAGWIYEEVWGERRWKGETQERGGGDGHFSAL